MFKMLDRGGGHFSRGGIGAEEGWGDHVDADVCALGAENGRDQELPWGSVVEGALGVAVGFVKDAEDFGYAAGFGFEFGYAVAGRGFADGLGWAVGAERFGTLFND